MKWEYLTVNFVDTGAGLIVNAEGNTFSDNLLGRIEKFSSRQQVLDLVGEYQWELVSVVMLRGDILMYTFKRKLS